MSMWGHIHNGLSAFISEDELLGLSNIMLSDTLAGHWRNNAYK